MRKLSFLSLTILICIIFFGILDAKNYDNFLYHFLHIGSLKYYDLPIWSFFQSVGALAVFAGIYLAYETWNLETRPIVYATGFFFISLYEEDEANSKRDELILESQTFQLVNVGRSPANNVILSKHANAKGEVLEDSCPHSFAIPSNQGTRDLGEVLRIHGDKKIFNNTDKQICFYIHYQDNKGKTDYTRITFQRVERAEGKIGRIISNSVQMWKVVDNS